MLINELPFIMIRCLVLTILFEVVIALGVGVRKKLDLVNIILVNVLTNPIVVTIPVYFNVRYSVEARHISLLILEILAVFTEGFIYKKYLNYKKINPFIISLILNGVSYMSGVIINHL